MSENQLTYSSIRSKELVEHKREQKIKTNKYTELNIQSYMLNSIVSDKEVKENGAT
jgi:hypothetical protein